MLSEMAMPGRGVRIDTGMMMFSGEVEKKCGSELVVVSPMETTKAREARRKKIAFTVGQDARIGSGDLLWWSYILVNSCQDRSYLYLLAMGWNIVYQFRKAQNEIDRYLRIVPLITLVDTTSIGAREWWCWTEGMSRMVSARKSCSKNG